MEISELYSLFLASKGVNTDTRTIQPGQIFVALKGETFDGNAYALPSSMTMPRATTPASSVSRIPSGP